MKRPCRWKAAPRIRGPILWAGLLLASATLLADSRFTYGAEEAAALAAGERLTFSIRWGLVRAGQAIMNVVGIKRFDGHLCYEIVSTAESNPFFDQIYPVRDRFVSLVDRDSLYTRYFQKKLREGKYRADQTIHFVPEKGKATYQDGKEYDIPRRAFDAIAAFYYVRTRPLAVGQSFDVESHADRQNYPLKITVLGREKIETPAGTFDCLVVEPKLRSGAFFKNEGRLTLWLTDDERRMPVQMRSRIAVGSITVVLTDFVRPSGPQAQSKAEGSAIPSAGSDSAASLRPVDPRPH